MRNLGSEASPCSVKDMMNKSIAISVVLGTCQLSEIASLCFA